MRNGFQMGKAIMNPSHFGYCLLPFRFGYYLLILYLIIDIN